MVAQHAEPAKLPKRAVVLCGVARDVFPAKASPTVLPRSNSGTGFSREEAGVGAIRFAVWREMHSRLKPVLQVGRVQIVGPASAGKRPVWAPSDLRC